ncbi:MAG: patatin-like phospholipase family protein [Phycisphaerales bacterium]
MRLSPGVVAWMSAASILAPLVGCAPKVKSPPIEELEANEIGYLGEVSATQDRIEEEILLRSELEYERAVAAGHPDDRTFDVLILSGGGAKGAFGAGFLLGWGEVKDPQFARPEFDLVTGVSTGSLIAPMAFVGDEASYALADQIYRNPSQGWIKERSLLDVLINEESVYNDAGLLKSIEQTVGPRIPAIAAQVPEHRLLLIGVTNLNQGGSRTWNLTELAAQVQQGRMTPDEFCRYNLSSASIPAVFPPQLIGGNLYVDGSTTRDILYIAAFDSSGSAVARWRERHPDVKPPKVRVWVIANTPLVVPPEAVDASDMGVIKRSLALAVQAALTGQLKIVELSSRILHESIGVDVEFRYVAMPDGWTATGKGIFNKADMDAMSDLGRAMGRDPRNWRTSVDDPLSPAALTAELERQLAKQQEAGREPR